MKLTSEQFEVIRPILKRARKALGRHKSNEEGALNSILWYLRTENEGHAEWPPREVYGVPSSTCSRIYKAWREAGVVEEVLVALLCDLRDRGGVDLESLAVMFAVFNLNEEIFDRGRGTPTPADLIPIMDAWSLWREDEGRDGSWQWETASIFSSGHPFEILEKTVFEPSPP
jgi:transposase